MRKTWITWKAKYHVCVCSSISESDTAPESFARTAKRSEEEFHSRGRIVAYIGI
jgi:hypothetical protein